jgi:hypothetical protein
MFTKASLLTLMESLVVLPEESFATNVIQRESPESVTGAE